jgi:chromosome segregation ATPase
MRYDTIIDDNSQTYTPNKDGTISIKGEDGKEVRFAKESDLLAVKGGKEAAETELGKAKETHESKITEITTAHQSEIQSLNTKLSESATKLLQAEAAKEKLEERVNESAGLSSELAGAKQELEDAKKASETAAGQLLETRRQLIIVTYNVAADSVKDKTMEQLDALEEALKATRGSRAGPYASVTAPGGGGEAPSDMERAKQIIADAEEKRRSG